jgi:uncharacterized protein YndB with AHSA1/START domain
MENDLTLRLTRVLPAPAERVFGALSTQAALAKWFGPRGFTAQAVVIDLRVGGRYRITMQPPEGDRFHISGAFLAVEPTQRLTYTFEYEEPDTDDRETTVTLTIDGHDQSSDVTMVQTGFATEARRTLHEQGWSESLDRLAEYLTR